MHRFRLLEFHCHQFNTFVYQIKGSFATAIKHNINVLKPIPTGLVGGIEVNESVVVLDKSIGPGLEKPFLFNDALLIDGNFLIEECLNDGGENDFESFLVDILEVFDF